MTLSESIERYNVRKTLRFEMKPVARTAEFISDLLAGDEDRAQALNTVKAAIEAEHLTMVRRVFKGLPDPLPDFNAIKAAFRDDPEYDTLSSRKANDVLNLIIDRCNYNRWAVPAALRACRGWQPLFIKWHWFCKDKYAFSGAGSLPSQWAGKLKSEIEATCPLLRTPKKRKPSRNFWYEHAPFRIMFDNHSCGMSWLKEDFPLSRTFFLRDADRFLIGIVPRTSKFNPHTLGNPLPEEQHYELYEETAGEPPRFRAIPRALVDAPAHKGFVFLFELSGRCLRNASNMNAQYLRALMSAANLKDPTMHLDKIAEFYARTGSDIPKDGKPDHFRQRFTECKFLVTLHVTVNPQMVSTGTRPLPYGSLAKLIETNPYAKFLHVRPTTCGYVVLNADASHTQNMASSNVATTAPAGPTPRFDNAKLCNESPDQPTGSPVGEDLDRFVSSTPDDATLEKTDRGVAREAGVVATSVFSKSAYRDSDLRSIFISTKEAISGKLAGTLAKMVVEQDAYVLFDPSVPEAIRRAVKDKFDYIVIRGREPFAPGGVLHGYQLVDRLFVGDMAEATEKARAANEEAKQKAERQQAEEEARAAKAAEKAARRAKAEEEFRLAQERRAAAEKLAANYDDSVFKTEFFQTGRFPFKFGFKTSDNIRHEVECRADDKDDVFQKLRTIGIRPYRVECTDPTYVGIRKDLPGPDVGSIRFGYAFRDSQNIRHDGVVLADTKDEAYAKLKKLAINPFFVAPEGTPPLSIADRLKRLNALKEQGLLTEEEYTAQRAKVISEL